MVLSFIDHQGIEGRPLASGFCVPGDRAHVAGQVDFVVIPPFVDGGTRSRRGEFVAGLCQFSEQLFPAVDHDLTAVEMAHGDQALELGGEREVVDEEHDAPPVALASIAEGLLQGVSGLAGPGAAPDQKLAVVAELVEQGELRRELALEHLLGVVEEAAASGRLDAGPEDGEHPVALRRKNRLGTLSRSRSSQMRSRASRPLRRSSSGREIPWKVGVSLEATSPGMHSTLVTHIPEPAFFNIRRTADHSLINWSTGLPASPSHWPVSANQQGMELFTSSTSKPPAGPSTRKSPSRSLPCSSR